MAESTNLKGEEKLNIFFNKRQLELRGEVQPVAPYTVVLQLEDVVVTTKGYKALYKFGSPLKLPIDQSLYVCFQQKYYRLTAYDLIKSCIDVLVWSQNLTLPKPPPLPCTACDEVQSRNTTNVIASVQATTLFPELFWYSCLQQNVPFAEIPAHVYAQIRNQVTFVVSKPNKLYAYASHMSKPSQLHVYVAIQRHNKMYLSQKEFNLLKLVETLRGVTIAHLNQMVGDLFA